jgi:hypothetical protein
MDPEITGQGTFVIRRGGNREQCQDAWDKQTLLKVRAKKRSFCDKVNQIKLGYKQSTGIAQ